MLKLIIIEDEEDARIALRSYIKNYCTGVKVIAEAANVKQGISAIILNRPDGILLDIQLNDGTGFDLLDHFPVPDFRIIFTTAFDQYALKAFKYCALDYLLKPIDPVELSKAVEKLKNQHTRNKHFEQQMKLLANNLNGNSPKRLAISTSEGLIFMDFDEIKYLKAENNYTFFYCNQGDRHVVSKTLKDFDELLPDAQFLRVHQTYVINIKSVRQFLKEDGGYALLDNGDKIPVSRRKKEAFLNKMLGKS